MADISKVPGRHFKDGRDRYRARFRDSTGTQVVRQFRTRRDAQAWLDQAAHDRVAGIRTDRARQTLAELYEEFLASKSQPFAPKTLEIYAGVWTRVPPRVRATRIGDVDAETVDRVLAKVNGPASQAKLRSLLSAMFNFAISRRRLSVNPARRTAGRKTRAEVMATRGSEDTKRYLTSAELRQLVAELPEKYRALVRVMAHVGLRPGEAYALTAGQFDALNRTLRVDRSVTGPTKTGETRTIKLPAVVTDLLLDHVTRFVENPLDPDALLFGKLNVNNWRRRVFQAAAKRAGLGNLRVNDLRHTAVSFAIGHGASVYDVQRMVGHSKPSITLDVYGELWDASADRLAERLDEAIRAELLDEVTREDSGLG
jgi:integrase